MQVVYCCTYTCRLYSERSLASKVKISVYGVVFIVGGYSTFCIVLAVSVLATKRTGVHYFVSFRNFE